MPYCCHTIIITLLLKVAIALLRYYTARAFAATYYAHTPHYAIRCTYAMPLYYAHFAAAAAFAFYAIMPPCRYY